MADDILKNIPLPADLPENWTSQQTVAPTGAEVGMDEQYGYNYLMRQVNNAQKALKALVAQREEDRARIKFWASNDPTSPASFIGGTWERIENCFIMGASDDYPAGSTGGEAAHELTRKEMPEHKHFYRADDYQSGSPQITFPAWSWGMSKNIILQNTAEVTTTGASVTPDGNSQPHNNIPPYYSMYIWRRVA